MFVATMGFKKMNLSVSFQREAAGSSAPQEGEQNGTMGKLDEGLDDFFSKKVIKLSFR